MSRGNRRRWSLRLTRWHRWAGLAAAVFVIVLGATGLALQHAPALGLDAAAVGSPGLARALGLRVGEPVGVRVGGTWVVAVGERLFVGDCGVDAGTGDLRGAVAASPGFAVAHGDDVVLFGGNGRRLERLRPGAGLPEAVVAIGRSEAGPAVIRGASGRLYRPLEDWLEFRRYGGEPPAWSRPTAPPPRLSARLRERALGDALTWERLMLELHSGRIAGNAGRIVMDVAAIGLLVLAVTGLYLWWRRR